MQIFKEDKASKLSCGINDDGDLFFGDDKSGSNLPDTPENRELVVRLFNEEMRRLHHNSDLFEVKLPVSNDLSKIFSDLENKTAQYASDKYGFDFNEVISKTAVFSNGYEMDIKFVVPPEPDHYCWTEAVLFKNGHQIACSDVEDSFLGDWELEDHDGNKYMVSVVPEKIIDKESSLEETQYVVQSSKSLGDGKKAGSPDRFYTDSLGSAEEAYRIECGKGRLVDLLYGSPKSYRTLKANYDFRDGRFVLNPSEPDFRNVFSNDGENTVIFRQENVTSALDRAEGLSQYLLLGRWKQNEAMPEGEYATWIAVNNNVNGDFGRREGNYFPTFNCSGAEALDAAFSDFKARLEKERDRMNRDQKKAEERGFTH